jgi:cytoskeletal protein RodZ
MQQQAETQAQGIAAMLRRARMRRGTKIEVAARDTCISIGYLSALEEGAPLGAFPAPVYARGFLREYARYLGLDPEPLVDRYWEGHVIPDPVTSNTLGDAARYPDLHRRRLGLRRRPR